MMRESWASVHHLKVASRVGFIRRSQRHVRLPRSSQVTFAWNGRQEIQQIVVEMDDF